MLLVNVAFEMPLLPMREGQSGGGVAVAVVPRLVVDALSRLSAVGNGGLEGGNDGVSVGQH